MTLRPDIIEFIDALEVFAKRKLNYPLEVGELLQMSAQTGLTREFEELIFQAKFLVRTQEVMKRIGKDAQGFEKLSVEFQSGLEKAMNLLKNLSERAGQEGVQKYSTMFFAMETESIARLMILFSDLSWIKNYQVDGKLLPYETVSMNLTSSKKNSNLEKGTPQQVNQLKNALSRIQRSAVLAAVLFVLVALIDPPVTILGWILTLGIIALLVYISIQLYFLHRT
jgi:hypothetical protein